MYRINSGINFLRDWWWCWFVSAGCAWINYFLATLTTDAGCDSHCTLKLLCHQAATNLFSLYLIHSTVLTFLLQFNHVFSFAHPRWARCCWWPGHWRTADWSIRPPSAQTPERRSQRARRQSTDTPAPPWPESACSAARHQASRTSACFTPFPPARQQFDFQWESCP